MPNKITEAFHRAKSENRTAIMPFVTVGHPEIHSTVAVGIGSDDANAISDRAGYRSPIDVSNDQMLSFGEISIRCISTPGHTPGSTCYLLPAESPSADPHVFTGDTLFPGGPGKTDNVEAFQQIVNSITTQLHTLPSNTVALPGHGDSTTIAKSIEEYKVFETKQHPPDLFGEVAWM